MISSEQSVKSFSRLILTVTLLSWSIQSNAGSNAEIKAAKADVKSAKQELVHARQVLRELRGIDDTDEAFSVDALQSLIQEVDSNLNSINYNVNISMIPTSVQNYENRGEGGRTVSAGHQVHGKNSNFEVSKADGTVMPASKYKSRTVNMRSALVSHNGFDQHVRCYNMSNSSLENGTVAIMVGYQIPRARLYHGFYEIYKHHGAKKLLQILEPNAKKWSNCKKIERALYKKLASMTIEEAEAVDMSKYNIFFELDVVTVSCNWP